MDVMESQEHLEKRLNALYPIFNENDTEGNKLKIAFKNLHRIIEGTCPETRHRSIALTELENACMWAVKSLHSKTE